MKKQSSKFVALSTLGVMAATMLGGAAMPAANAGFLHKHRVGIAVAAVGALAYHHFHKKHHRHHRRA